MNFKIPQGMTRHKASEPADGWYEITPAAAQTIFDGRAKNRPIKMRLVQKMSAEIQSGTFKPNGETCVFDENGRLIDGQNRMRSCVVAGKPIVVYCVFGIPTKFFPSFDQGAGRGGNDIASLMGFKNANTIAAVARLSILYSDGSIADTGVLPFSKDRLTAYLKRNHDLLQSAVNFTLSHSKGLRSLMPLSHPCFLYYYACEKQAAKSADFIEKLADGAGLSKGDPILMFRNRMQALAGEKHRLTTLNRLAILIKTWNACVNGKPLGVLRWSQEIEVFPKIALAAASSAADED